MAPSKCIPFDLVNAFIALCDAYRPLLHDKRILEGRSPSLQGEAILLNHTTRMLQDAKYLLGEVIECPAARPAAIRSFCAELVALLPPAKPGSVTLDIEMWRKLTHTIRPDEFDMLVSRGLGLGPELAQVFKALDQMKGLHASWAQKMARTIGRDIGSVQCYRNLGRIVWFDPSIQTLRTPLMAPWMKAQVQAFPNDTIDVICTAKVQKDFDTLIKFFLAGAPVEFFLLDPSDDPRVENLVGKMSSNHGKLDLISVTGDLEQYLSQDPIEDWRPFIQAKEKE